MDKLELKGLVFNGCHGCRDYEKTDPQPFIIDATLYLSLQKSGLNDDISATVDYMTVASMISDIISGESVDLIETLAVNIGNKILTEFDLVKKVRTTVHKEIPLQFSDNKPHHVSVTITVKRPTNNG